MHLFRFELKGDIHTHSYNEICGTAIAAVEHKAKSPAQSSMTSRRMSPLCQAGEQGNRDKIKVLEDNTGTSMSERCA